jgi:hypothetical protein
MAKRDNPNVIQRYLRSDKSFPIVAGIAAGLYPTFFYFTNNYSLINTWGHVAYFSLFFLMVPAIGFWIADRVFNLAFLSRWKKYLIPFLNVFVFLFLLKVCLYAGLQKKLILAILILAAAFAWFLYRHHKKLVVLQFVLAAISLVSLVPRVISQINYSSQWMQQPDAIEEAKFKKTPNIYLLQPDGYVNFSEINRGHYNYDNNALRIFLEKEGFVNYPGFRSNYASTLASNSSIFTMKHHYYNQGTSFNEALYARNIIVGDNPVLRLLKKNGYKTHLLIQKPYLLLNRPNLAYDACNFSMDEVGYIGTGLGPSVDLTGPLNNYLQDEPDRPKFFFLEIFNPGHIHNRKADSRGLEGERDLWFEGLADANNILKQTIDLIRQKDPGALIVIMADHGGFVGFEYTQQIYRQTGDRDLIYSIFSSQLSIHWPDGDIPIYDKELRTPVNLFRVLTSYLSEDQRYLEHLEDDGSYVILKEGVPRGVYQYITDDGSVILKKV